MVDARNLVSKIISGGQTGADQGGLDAALELGISCGGLCPKGRKSEVGPIPERYPLIESTRSSYLYRTEQNVIDSDGTILFTYGAPTGGSKRTIEFAEKHNRPWLHIDLNQIENAPLIQEMHEWLIGGGLMGLGLMLSPNPIINVAGSRESKNPGIQKRVKKLLIQTFRPEHYPMGGE